MELKAHKQDQVRVISVKGSVDALTAGDLSSFAIEQLGEAPNQLVIDLGQVEFMSSAGLRAILAILKEARQQGGDLCVAAAPPGVQNILKISGFTSIFAAFPSVEEAVSSYSG